MMDSGSSPGRKQLLAASALVALAVAVAHGGAVANDFVGFDDDAYIYDNGMVQGGLTRDSIRAAFSREAAETYFHPLTWLALMAVRAAFGPEPWGFHLVSVALHAVTAITLLLILRRATGRVWTAAAAACLFAVHPLTVEAVAWASELKTVLSTAIGMVAVLAYISHAARPARWRLALACLLMALSLLAKPGLVVLPALLLILDAWPLGRLGAGRGELPEPPPFPRQSAAALMWEKVPFALLALAGTALVMASAVRLAALRPSLAVLGANALAALPSYVEAIFWPAGLGPYHLYRAQISPGPTIAGAAVLVALVVTAVFSARRVPSVAFGCAWFLVALLPYLGLSQAGMWPAWADRFAYVPLMGVSVAVTYAAADLAGRARGRAAAAGSVAVAVAACLALTAATRTQVSHWSDSVAIFRRACEIEPSATHMRFNLGAALVAAGRHSEAVGALQKALSMSPYSGRGHALIGLARAGLGQDNRAAASFRLALQLDGGAVEALRGMGDLLARSGDVEGASAYYARLAEAADRLSERDYALRRLRELQGAVGSTGRPLRRTGSVYR